MPSGSSRTRDLIMYFEGSTRMTTCRGRFESIPWEFSCCCLLRCKGLSCGPGTEESLDRDEVSRAEFRIADPRNLEYFLYPSAHLPPDGSAHCPTFLTSVAVRLFELQHPERRTSTILLAVSCLDMRAAASAVSSVSVDVSPNGISISLRSWIRASSHRRRVENCSSCVVFLYTRLFIRDSSCM